MTRTADQQRSRGDRIRRLRSRLAALAEADAKERISDPVVSILKGLLDLLEDEA